MLQHDCKDSCCHRVHPPSHSPPDVLRIRLNWTLPTSSSGWDRLTPIQLALTPFHPDTSSQKREEAVRAFRQRRTAYSIRNLLLDPVLRPLTFALEELWEEGDEEPSWSDKADKIKDLGADWRKLGFEELKDYYEKAERCAIVDLLPNRHGYQQIRFRGVRPSNPGLKRFEVLTAEDLPLTWRSDYVNAKVDNRTLSTLQLTAIVFLADNPEDRALARQEWTARWNKRNAPPPSTNTTAPRSSSWDYFRRSDLPSSRPRESSSAFATLAQADSVQAKQLVSSMLMMTAAPKPAYGSPIFSLALSSAKPSAKPFASSIPPPPSRKVSEPRFGVGSMAALAHSILNPRPRRTRTSAQRYQDDAGIAASPAVAAPPAPAVSCPTPSVPALPSSNTPSSATPDDFLALAIILGDAEPPCVSSSSLPLTPASTPPPTDTNALAPTPPPCPITPAPPASPPLKRLATSSFPLPSHLLRQLRIIALQLPLSTSSSDLSTLLEAEGMPSPDGVKLPSLLSESHSLGVGQGDGERRRQTLLAYSTLDSAMRAFGVLSALCPKEEEEERAPRFVDAEEGEGDWRWSDLLEGSEWGKAGWEVEQVRRKRARGSDEGEKEERKRARRCSV